MKLCLHLTAVLGLALTGAFAQEKSPAKKIKDGTVEAGSGVKEGTVKVAGKVKDGTVTAAEKTADTSKSVGGKVKDGTVTAADKVGDTSKEGAKRVVRGGRAVGKGFKNAAKEVSGGNKEKPKE